MREPDLVQSIPARGITSLRLNLVSGDIHIESRERDDIRILAFGIRENPQAMPALKRIGDVLRLDSDTECALSLLHQPERLKLIIQIPAGLQVTVRMLAGSLQLNAAFSEFDSRVRFGSIAGCAPAKRIRIRVFAGDVRLGGLTGAADVQLSLGDLTMAWASLPVGEMVLARSFAGDTHLDLPDHLALVDGRAVIQPQQRATAILSASPQVT